MHFSGPKGGGKLFSLRPSPFFLFTFFPEEFTHKPLGGADHMGFPHWRWEKVRSCRARSRVSGSRWEEKGANPPPPHTHRRSATWGCQVRRVFTCGGRPALCVWAHRKWRAASTVRDKADEEGAQCKVFGEDIRTQAGWGEATQTSNPAEGTEPQPSVRPHRGDRGREEISVMFREQDQTSNHIKDNGSQVSHRQRRNLQMQTPWCWCWMRIRGMEVNSWFSTWKLTVEIKTARVSAVGMCVCMCVTPWKNGSFPAGAGKNKTSLEHLTLGNTALEEWRRHGKRHRLPTWRASADQIEEQLN